MLREARCRRSRLRSPVVEPRARRGRPRKSRLASTWYSSMPMTIAQFAAEPGTRVTSSSTVTRSVTGSTVPAPNDGHAVHALGQRPELGLVPAVVARASCCRARLLTRSRRPRRPRRGPRPDPCRARPHRDGRRRGVEVVDVERDVDRRHRTAESRPVDRAAGEDARELEKHVVVVLQRGVPLGGVDALRGRLRTRAASPTAAARCRRRPGLRRRCVCRSLTRSPSRTADWAVGCLIPTIGRDVVARRQRRPGPSGAPRRRRRSRGGSRAPPSPWRGRGSGCRPRRRARACRRRRRSRGRSAAAGRSPSTSARRSVRSKNLIFLPLTSVSSAFSEPR